MWKSPCLAALFGRQVVIAMLRNTVQNMIGCIVFNEKLPESFASHKFHYVRWVCTLKFFFKLSPGVCDLYAYINKSMEALLMQKRLFRLIELTVHELMPVPICLIHS